MNKGQKSAIYYQAIVKANNQAIYLDKLASCGIISEGGLYGSWEDGEDEIEAAGEKLEWGMHYVVGPLWRGW